MYEDDFYEDGELTEEEELDELWEDLEAGDIDAAELRECLDGRFGPEIQQFAAELTDHAPEDHGADGYSQEDHEWAEAFTASQSQLEQKLGRHLTRKEVDKLAVRHERDDEPDLVKSYEETTGRDPSGSMRDKEQRQQLGREAFHDHAQALAEEGFEMDGSPSPEPDEALAQQR